MSSILLPFTLGKSTADILNNCLGYFLKISSASILFILFFVMLYYVPDESNKQIYKTITENFEPEKISDYFFAAATVFYILYNLKAFVDIAFKIIIKSNDSYQVRKKVYKFFLLFLPYFAFLLPSYLIERLNTSNNQSATMTGKVLFFIGIILFVFQPLVLRVCYYLPRKYFFEGSKNPEIPSDILTYACKPQINEMVKQKISRNYGKKKKRKKI